MWAVPGSNSMLVLLSMSTKTVAIFGGAFDPIHQDHVRLAKLCLDIQLCDELWLIPSPDRWDKKLFASPEDRLNVLDLVIGGDAGVAVSEMELQMEDYRGSYVTMSTLREKYPDLNFRLLVGADSYVGIPHWRDPLHFYGTEFNGPRLLKEFELIVFERRGIPMPDPQEHKAKGYADIFLVGKEQGFDGKFASSDIRKELFFGSGKNPEGLDSKVFEYIRKNHLYRL